MSEYQRRFGGIESLYGVGSLEKLRASFVMVVGIGGVGSWTAEALARSGVGAIALVDMDDICVTNTNRQIHALDGNYGTLKVDALADRISRINPECRVSKEQCFFTERTADALFSVGPDWVVDAIDTATQKCRLIDLAKERTIKIVTVGGVGGRLEPTLLKTCDLNRTKIDPLLFRVRKLLRQRHGWPRGKGDWGVMSVFSEELPPSVQGECDVPMVGKIGCEGGLGAVTMVTATAGFMAASVVVNTIAKSQ